MYVLPKARPLPSKLGPARSPPRNVADGQHSEQLESAPTLREEAWSLLEQEQHRCIKAQEVLQVRLRQRGSRA
eukprot:2359656-Amphidinium_carterae.1